MTDAHEITVDELWEAWESSSVLAIAEQNLERANRLGLSSDWAGIGTKALDFARLVVAARRILPAGGSVETGVFQGGTSALLILSSAPDSFHISIDPYGLPTQSYSKEEYEDWEMARRTISGLANLAVEKRVTHCHYLMDSQSFVRADLLRHPGRFAILHLDGFHSEGAVREELTYFLERLPGPTVYILDDHDDGCPGVAAGLAGVEHSMRNVFHRYYDTEWGASGFSAWFNPADDSV